MATSVSVPQGVAKTMKTDTSGWQHFRRWICFRRVQIKNDIKAAEQGEELLNFYQPMDN